MRRLAFALLLPLLLTTSPGAGAAQQQLGFHFAYRPAAFDALRESIQQVTLISPEPFIVDEEGHVTGTHGSEVARHPEWSTGSTAEEAS